MKKKTLLFTTIAGTMFIAGLSMTNVKAASAEPTAKFGVNYPAEGQNSVVVELMDGSLKLTRAEVAKLVEARYVNEVNGKKVPMNVKVATIDGKAVTENDTGLVGTGSVVKLSTGKELTVVLYGDVDGNGELTNADAQRVLEYKYGKATLTEAQVAAADVLLAGGYGDTGDAQRILEYYFYSNGSTTQSYKDKFGKDEYAEKFVKMQDEQLVAMNVTAAVEKDTTHGVYVAEVSEDGTEVEVKVIASEVQPSVFNQVEAKWVRVALNANVTGWKIDENPNVVAETNADGTIKPGTAYVYVNVAENKDVVVTLRNSADTTEVMNVTFKVVDVTMPEVTTIREFTNKTTGTENEVRNSELTNTLALSSKTVTVTGNASAMAKYTDAKGNEGKWFRVEVITDMPEIAVYTIGTDEEGNDIIKTDYVVENLGAIATGDANYSSSKTLYKAVILLDASNSGAQFVVSNPEAVIDQLKEPGVAYTLNITNTGDTTITAAKAVVPTTGDYDKHAVNPDGTEDRGTSVMNTNQGAVTVEPVSGNVITVKGTLNTMKTFQLDANYKVVADATTTTMAAVGGHKYYALVVTTTDYQATKLQYTGTNCTIVPIKTNTTNYKVFMDGTGRKGDTDTDVINSFLVWLDAEAEVAPTFTLKGRAEDLAGKYDEETTYTVEFVDTGAPKAALADITKVDNEVRSMTSTIGASQAVTSLSDLKVTIRTAAMTQTVRYADEQNPEGEKGFWYALKVKTGVNNSQLKVEEELAGGKKREVPQTGVELAADEVLLWVNAGDVSNKINAVSGLPERTFKVTNKNNTGAPLTIKVTTGDESDLRTDVLRTDEFISDVDLTKVLPTTDAKTAYANSMATLSTPRATGTTKDSVTVDGKQQSLWVRDTYYTLPLNLNLLKALPEYAFNGKTGHWVAYTLYVRNNSNINDGWVNDYIYVDRTNVKDFVKNTTDRIILWMDVTKLPSIASSKIVDLDTKIYSPVTIKAKDTSGVEESLVLHLRVSDTSTFTSATSTPEAKKGFTLTDEFIKDTTHKVYGSDGHFTAMSKTDAAKYLANQSLVDSITQTREGNVITVKVTGDFASMYDIRNNVGKTGKTVTLKLDLGVNCESGYVYRAAGPDEDITQQQFKNLTVSDKDDYGCTETEDYWNDSLPEIKNTGLVYTTILEYAKGSAGTTSATGDTLKFIIEYHQTAVDLDNAKAQLEYYTQKLNEFYQD